MTTHAPGPSTASSAGLDAAQLRGTGDMDVESLRAALHASADLIADYLADVEGYPVLPSVAPGELAARLDGPPPEQPTPMSAILADIEREVLPSVTHWQHPGFLAYFGSTASGPGLVGEAIMTGLNANAMLWRTSPVATELEAITVGWLREALGLPAGFDGLYTDTASISTLSALAAAREHAAGDVAQAGLGGSAALAGARGLRIYASQEAHSSIDKAAMTLGIGRDGVRKVAVDDELAMIPHALETAIAEDRASGWVPCAVVSTIGTTSTTAIDPVASVAVVCERERLWHHVDAAYAGPVALIPERRGPFAGWERADSIVLNPHKWLFTPLDCSLLLTRRPETLRAAFSLVPEYLRTTDGASGRDYHESSPQLGRRARSIKMWILLRYFGLDGLRRRIRAHLDLARWLAQAVDAEPDAERLAPTPFATVVLRWRPARDSGRADEPAVAERLDALNERLLARLNETGEVFLSHTRVGGRFALRVAINGIRTEARHVERAWDLIRQHGRQLDLDAP